MLSLLLALAAQSPCEARLLDYRNWREAPDQRWDASARFTSGGTVTLIGAEHSRDPAHPQFARIAAAFAEARPSQVFFEGPERALPERFEDAIPKAGEAAYLRFLAARAGVSAASLEPSPVEQVAALKGQWSGDQILLFFVLREAARLRDRDHLDDAGLERAMAGMLAKVTPLAQAAGLDSSIRDVPSLAAAAAREWPGRDWRSLPGAWFSPLASDAEARFLPAINAADSGNRNAHMLRRFAEAARGGARVFVVVGRNHVPMIAPALACEAAR